AEGPHPRGLSRRPPEGRGPRFPQG
ncbi:hypothetical protein BN1723_019632, partial [Verticillium longisporum]